MAKNFWNCSIRETTMGLKDNVDPDPNKSSAGTIATVLNCRGL